MDAVSPPAPRSARAVVVPADAVGVVLEELDRAFSAERFARRPHCGVDGVLRVYGRGSSLGDILINGSGLSAFIRRVGPLSVSGVVVVWAASPDPSAQLSLVISLVAGHEIGREFASAADAAVRAAGSRGVPLHDDGWRRSVDVPEGNPANPNTAKALRLG